MRQGEKPPLALQIIFLGKHLGYLMEHRLAHHGLNRTQAMILSALNHHPGMKALDLCVPARVEPANVTRTLQSLERLGLLERRAHPTDGRVSLFYLTPEGHTLARQISESMAGLSADLFQGMDPQELSVMEKALGRLWKAISVQRSAFSYQTSGTREPVASETSSDEVPRRRLAPTLQSGILHAEPGREPDTTLNAES